MNKKRIYMVQVDLAYGDNDKAVYLPYAIGLLVAFAMENKAVRENYSLGRLVFIREAIDNAIDSFEDPFLVGFSNYVWNNEYNKLFARKLKEKYPNCIIVFGGHNVPPDTSLLAECPFIDVLVHGEGEEAFLNLLLAYLTKSDLFNIPNISFRDVNKLPVSSQRIHVSCPLEDYPSPYLSGLFDDLIEQNSDYTFCSILETSRDCPFLCAFCDWGQLSSKTRRFSTKQVMEEIEWFSRNKITYIWGADANFGMFDDDIDIANSLIEAKQRTGYPQIFNINYSKTKADNVFLINKLLNESKMSRGVPLSFQSFSPIVLKNICRKNMDLKNFSNLIAKYNEAGVTTYSELIIGLPGETYESFCRGIGILFEAGQHKTLNVYNYELLCNSALGSPESVENFKIETVRIPLIRFHCELSEAYIPEFSNIVVSTCSMNRAMWKRSSLFSVSIQSFHNLGLLRCFAIYLYYEKSVNFESFYQALQQWMEFNPDSVSGHIYKKLSSCYDDVLAGKVGLYYSNLAFGHIVWPYAEACLLENLYRFDDCFNDLENFLKTFNIEENIYTDLLEYQKCTLKLPNKSKADIQLNYDFYSYFKHIYLNDYRNLENKANITHTRDDNFSSNWVDYARENVWYGHNENRNIISDINVEYI